VKRYFILSVIIGVLAVLLLASCTPTANLPSAKAYANQAPMADITAVSSPTAENATASPVPSQTIQDPTFTAAIPNSGVETPLPQEDPASDTPEVNPTPTITTAAEPVRTEALFQRASADEWKDWPIIPQVPEEMRAVYQRGLQNGNNPHAFSILGDCQSQPEVFLGPYDSDPIMVQALPDHLLETVENFSGSFDRYSPTVKDGTTEGALLWIQWNDNKEKKCNSNESPLDCELRVHQPSIVFIHVGTHYESRNRRYLTIIIEKILETGAVPVLVTKADNREMDERVNHNLASLAEEFNLPLWNFWSSVQHLSDGGMEPGSDMYLSDEGMVIHREDGLKVLDTIWRALQ
jgi:hypothetical protein